MGVRLDQHVFENAKKPWRADRLAKKVAHWYDKFGMDEAIVPVWARHAFCTDAVISGVSYEDLALLVGDSPEALRSAYGHVRGEYLLALAEKIERRRVR
jgi:site-specific recombinase XerD